MKKYMKAAAMLVSLVVTSVSFAQDGTRQPVQKRTSPGQTRTEVAKKNKQPVRMMRAEPVKKSCCVKQ